MTTDIDVPAELVTEEVARPRRRRGAEEAAFRASVEERLRSLEAEIGEVKLRLNGLLFFIASTVLGQVLLKVFS